MKENITQYHSCIDESINTIAIIKILIFLVTIPYIIIELKIKDIIAFNISNQLQNLLYMFQYILYHQISTYSKTYLQQSLFLILIVNSFFHKNTDFYHILLFSYS